MRLWKTKSIEIFCTLENTEANNHSSKPFKNKIKLVLCVLSGKRVLYLRQTQHEIRSICLIYRVWVCCVYCLFFSPPFWERGEGGEELTWLNEHCCQLPSQQSFSLYIYNYFIVRYDTHFDSSWLFHLHKITSSPFTQQQFSHHTQHVLYDPRKSIVQSINSATTVIASNDMFTNDENLVTPNSFFFGFVHTCTHARWNTNPKTLTPPKNIYCRVVFFSAIFLELLTKKYQKNLKYNNNKKEFYLKKSIMWIASMQRVLMIATNCWRLLIISLLDYITICLVLHHLSLVCLNCFCFFFINANVILESKSFLFTLIW